MFPTLKLKNVYIKNEDRLLEIINIILKDGSNSLQIVTDFDMTLTKQHVNGKEVLSSFAIFNQCKQLPETYSKESSRLYKKYRPIEIDPYLPIDVKAEEMTNWIVGKEKVLKGVPFDPNEIEEVSRVYGTDLRDGTEEIFKKFDSANIPVLVFSAGLGEVVEAVLRNKGILFNNVKVISNFLKYKDGKIVGFRNKKLIHAFNKNEHAVEQEYFKILESRRNVLLMGDSLGDASMIDGMKDIGAVLKIGFLYDHVSIKHSKYL
nr:7-methylguanosine phosphate-specific 5'-nucleotidase-like [Megalopta genalis]